MLVALLILMTGVALVALALFFAYHRRELRRLRHHHRAELEQVDDDYHKRVARLDREHTRELHFAHHPVVRDLLPVLDALDEGLRHHGPQSEEHPLVDGLVLARRSLVQALGRHGIERMEPGPGDVFDPQWHEAIATRESDEVAAGTILCCLRAGYRHEERQLRAAMVEVATAQRVDAPESLPESSPADDASSPCSDEESPDSISSAATSDRDSPSSEGSEG